MNKRLSSKRGITLIALIVTIIILLILAGVAIANISGESGLFAKVKLAKQKYSISETKEKLELKITELRIEEEGKGETLTKEDLPKLNSDEIDVRSVESFPVEVICEKYKFNVDENFVVTYVGEVDGTIITYTTEPEGYTNQDEIEILIKVTNLKGIKTIEYPNGDKLEVGGATERGTDYKVNANGTYTFKIVDMENKEVTKDVVIDQIDKLEPLDFTPTYEKTEDGIKVIAETQDADYDETNTKSGIDYYEYYLKLKDVTEYTKYTTNQITGLKTGTYQLYVIAYDNAGNSKQCNTIEFKLTIPFVQISAGYSHVLALDKAGNLFAWGDNAWGQLGLENVPNVASPTQVKEGVKFKGIAAGTCANESFSLAIDENGNLWSWGYNRYGQLGNGTTSRSKKLPYQITQNIEFNQISAGENHCLALDNEGNIWSWGLNSFGQLGNGTTTAVYKPTKITIDGDVKFVQISAGMTHSLAIDESGNLWSWGDNGNGQLGGETTSSVTVPKKVEVENTKFKEISAGSSTTLLIDTNNDLWVCGYNYHGELGDGTTGVSKVQLKKIASDGKFMKISETQSYALAIDIDGNVWSWGSNSNGGLGNGTYTDVLIPTKVNIENVKFKEISAGGSENGFALDVDGKIWSWNYTPTVIQ